MKRDPSPHWIIAWAGALVSFGIGGVPAIAQPESFCDDPGTYELLVCIARGGEALGRGSAQILVRTVENPNNVDLRQLAEQNIREHQEISPYTFDSQQGYLVTQAQNEDVRGIPDTYAAFWVVVDDVPGAVVISSRCDCPGQRDRLVSLLERSSLLDNS